MSKFPSESKLRFWAENGLNVLFEGPHGVGKTAVAEETFNQVFGKQGKDWLYFSAATMDPWVDFVGVPKERVADDNVVYLDLVRPEVFARDQVKAIIFDEFNRAPKKVRNAVMELMQFKSINGHKFQNLKCVWAAINPSDDEENNYDVEKIDPAQIDRFHVHFVFGYDVNVSYFSQKYGEKGEIACEWWKSLTPELQKSISPRRLDYCVNMEILGGSIKDILPPGTPCKDLISQWKSGSFSKILDKITSGKMSPQEIRVNMNDMAFFNFVENKVKKNAALAVLLVPHMSSEEVAKFIRSNSISKVMDVLGGKVAKSSPEFIQTLQELVESPATGLSQTKRKKINTWLISTVGSNQSTGYNKHLYDFFSTEPHDPVLESYYQRGVRIQSFVSAIGEGALSEMEKNNDLKSAAIRLWEIIINNCQIHLLVEEIASRVNFSLNNSKKSLIKKDLKKFFESKEFDSTNNSSFREKLQTIIKSIETGKI